MPSQRAKENKALVAMCASCQKQVSTEEMIALTGHENGKAKQFSVCVPCADKGWRPPGFSGFYQPRTV